MNKNDEVKEYYGKTLKTNQDLKTNACCTFKPMPRNITTALQKVHPEVQEKYYGCGLTIPYALKDLKILDLGSGSGRDCYIASQLVGENGRVVGVDMTEEQLAVANKYLNFHAKEFGYKQSNVTFLKGNIEELDLLDLAPNTFDIIISNCVINLAQNKDKVFQDAFRLLKEGGELYFSDVYSDRRISSDLQNNKVLWGECLSGALYWNDFLRLAKSAGFMDPRLVESNRLTINNKEVENLIGDIKFYSATYRLFKVNRLESACEDYGHTAIYLGGIDDSENSFMLDNHHLFEKNKEYAVCGNTYEMLKQSRFNEYFRFSGNYDQHKGIFVDCGSSTPFEESSSNMSCC